MEEKKFDVHRLFGKIKKLPRHILSATKSFFTKDGFKSFLVKIKKSNLVDLIVRLCKAKNIPALIYLFLNIHLIGSFFFAISKSISGYFMGVCFYLFCVCISVSFVGEWIMQKFNGCKEIQDQAVLSRLEPLFFEVYNRAIKKQSTYCINEEITLYIKEDEDINAFAIGRQTICMTTGMLALPDEQIKAVLGHEMGHLANRDTDLIMLITVGNFLVTAFITVAKIFLFLFFGFLQIFMKIVGLAAGGSEGSAASTIANIVAKAGSFLTLLLVNVFSWIWTKIGVLLVMKSSRNQEYIADRFSCELGYSEPLLAFFESINTPASSQAEESGMIEGLKNQTELFAILESSHPDTQKRIDAIKSTFQTV